MRGRRTARRGRGSSIAEKQIGDCSGTDRPTQEVSLREVAAGGGQCVELLLGFDTLADDGDVERAGERDDCRDDRTCPRAGSRAMYDLSILKHSNMG